MRTSLIAALLLVAGCGSPETDGFDGTWVATSGTTNHICGAGPATMAQLGSGELSISTRVVSNDEIEVSIPVDGGTCEFRAIVDEQYNARFVANQGCAVGDAPIVLRSGQISTSSATHGSTVNITWRIETASPNVACTDTVAFEATRK